MTLCAGVCSFDGGLCSIRLSEPLLSLRPRSDLVNTLCHEMIHGWNFLVTGERSRDGHGPSFLKKAKEINEAAGTQITIFHSFNNEVAVYRTHIWKCNGICKTKPPFFGLVKRANNIAPQKADTWFEQHSKECGGTFIKISEPSKDSKSISTTKSIDGDKIVSKKRKLEIRDSKTLDSFWKKKATLTTTTTTTTMKEKGSTQTSKVEVINLEEDNEEEKKREEDDEVEVVVLEEEEEEEEEVIALDLDDVDDDDDNDSVVIISIE